VLKRALIFLIVLVCCANPAWARWHLDRKDFKGDFQLGTYDLKLRGVGVKTLFMMRLFVASFYLPLDTPVGRELSDVPKHLQVKFYTDIPSATFTSFTIAHMRPNVSREGFDRLKDRFKRMGELFPNIAYGDDFALTYEPGQGTSFVHNGKIRGTVQGADFAQAIFATWIGPHPIDHTLKEQVLGLDNAGN
jgi:hypothetical protein